MEFHPFVPKPKTKTEKSLLRRKKLKREYDEWIVGGKLYEKKKESSITLQQEGVSGQTNEKV